MVTIAEFKGINLIRLRLSYNSTAIEFISVSMLSKPCQMSLGMIIYHFLSNPIVINLNPYRNTLSALHVLVELPNLFYRIPQAKAYRFEYYIVRVIFSRFRDIAVWNLTSLARKARRPSPSLPSPPPLLPSPPLSFPLPSSPPLPSPSLSLLLS